MRHFEGFSNTVHNCVFSTLFVEKINMTRRKLASLKKYEAEVKRTRARTAAAATTDPEDNPDNDVPDLDNAGDKTKNNGKGRKRTLDSENEAGPSKKKTVEKKKTEPEDLGLSTDFEDSEELMGNNPELTEGENNISLSEDENGGNSTNQGRV